MIGKKLSPILVEIEDTIWEFEANVQEPPMFTDDGFRASIKIFMAALMDKMYALQREEKIELEDGGNMAFKAGQDLRNLVKTYTGIDTYDLYKKEDDKE